MTFCSCSACFCINKYLNNQDKETRSAAPDSVLLVCVRSKEAVDGKIRDSHQEDDKILLSQSSQVICDDKISA